MQEHLFEPILNLLLETMPRDNLLNSACLEFFDFIRKENIKVLISHLVENYRDKIKDITYVDIFSNFIMRYDRTQGFGPDSQFLDIEDENLKKPDIGRATRWGAGIKDLDPAEEEYFNTSDDEDEIPAKPLENKTSPNNSSPASKPLVDYNSDEEIESADAEMSSSSGPAQEAKTPESSNSKSSEDEAVLTPTSSSPSPTLPQRISEKRRREEDEEDGLNKLAHHKRRSSTSSTGSNPGNVLRRKQKFTNGRDNANKSNGGKTGSIAISLAPAIKTGGDSLGNGNNGN